MKKQIPSLAITQESEDPARSIPAWLLVPLGLLLLLLSAGCSKETSFSLFPHGDGNGTQQLSDVLPGRWRINTKDYHFTMQFGRHSEMSLVLDVPREYQARLKLEQIWVGGNYHLSGDDINVTFTDGRFATAMAQLRGLEVHHAKVVKFTNDTITDDEQNTWERIGSAPVEPAGEARDLAETAPANAALPPSPSGAAPNKIPQLEHLQAEREKLAALYGKLEKRRKQLNLKDSKALAAFNKDAAEYSQQVARLNAENNGSRDLASAKPMPGTAAADAPAEPIKAAAR